MFQLAKNKINDKYFPYRHKAHYVKNTPPKKGNEITIKIEIKNKDKSKRKTNVKQTKQYHKTIKMILINTQIYIQKAEYL